MDDGGLVGRVWRREAADWLAAHLDERYGISVRRVSALDAGVFRVDRRDGPAWVARVFPSSRPVEAVAGDAEILRALESAGFPAERCADAQPVSRLDGQGVLVTELVDGRRPEAPGRTFAVLGALLGRLHGRPATSMRAGGAWHHLAPQGAPRDEIAAACRLLDEHRPAPGAAARAPHDELRAAVEGADDCADLPSAFVHPDPVPVNTLQTPDEQLVLVDWAGAGRGPRVWSLGPLLHAAGARDLRLVDAALARYRRHTVLEPRELERLAGAIAARPLMIDCWSLGAGRTTAAEVLDRMPATTALAHAIAQRARRAFEADVDAPG